MIKMKIKCIEIEVALAKYFNVRRNIIVPNVSWGLFSHELDMCVVSNSGYVTEIEIKVSLSDLKKDLEKKHHHIDYENKIKYLYFAIPWYLQDKIEHIPDNAGVLIYNERKKIVKKRDAIKYKNCRPLKQHEIYQTARLGTMRIFGLKKKIIELQNKKCEVIK